MATNKFFFSDGVSEYKPEYCENDLFPDEEQRILDALGNQEHGIYKTADLDLTGLLCVEVYTGKRVKAQRRKIDELDNVTAWKI